MANHHNHHHQEVSTNFNKAFAIGVVLNLSFVFIEVAFGFYSHSLALLADAGHNLSDVASLLIAWGALYLASRPPSKKFTYGFRRSSILASLLNAVILLIAVGAIAWESVKRLYLPQQIDELTVISVALIGVLINTSTALLFASGRKTDINIRGAYLHMAADAAISGGVVLAGISMKYTGWLWLDPAMSFLIAIVIAISTWSLLKDSLSLALDAVPDSVDPKAVKDFLENTEGVLKIHDLHIWSMSTTEVALTVHLVMPAIQNEDHFLHHLSHELEHRFCIHHTTIQIERGTEGRCHLEPDDVV